MTFPCLLSATLDELAGTQRKQLREWRQYGSGSATKQAQPQALACVLGRVPQMPHEPNHTEEWLDLWAPDMGGDVR